MSAPPPGFYAKGIKITCGFETSGDPYQGVSGNFDKMGISCGCLQWNIGSNSLQPLVRQMPPSLVRSTMPTYGNGLLDACNAPVAKGLSIVNGWQPNNRLPNTAVQELRAMLGTTEMRAIQDGKIARAAEQAFTAATAWAKARGDAAATETLYCWFFDIVTQNGSLSPVTYEQVRDFVVANSPGRADDIVCDYQKNATGTSGFIKDAHKNAELWRNKPQDLALELLCASYLRAQTSRLQYRPLVINRKGAIAMGTGWVNGTLYKF